MLNFTCTDRELNDGFAWARERALSFVHDEDHVGPWYEAALPGRESFCIRDVCHYANGAHVLGLERHTKNMLLRFVQSIAESRDFCCFWEIDKNYRPTPCDYKSDSDFWYNLPANFDLIDACLRMYKLTGDKDYIESEDFLHFYRLTLNQYIKKWDIDCDGIPEGAGGVRRGIPSYVEQRDRGAAQSLDLLAAEAAAFAAFAEICELRGEKGAAYRERASAIRAEIDARWDESQKAYFFVKEKDGNLAHSPYGFEYVPYFGASIDERKLNFNLERLNKWGLENSLYVESRSHLSEIFYRYGKYDLAEDWLRRCTSADLRRREYPEVAFACIGAFVFGLMGITYDYVTKTVSANPHLPSGVTSASLTGLPVFGKTANICVKNGVVSITYTDKREKE